MEIIELCDLNLRVRLANNKGVFVDLDYGMVDISKDGLSMTISFFTPPTALEEGEYTLTVYDGLGGGWSEIKSRSIVLGKNHENLH